MQNMQKISNFKVGIIAPIFSENYKDFLDSITAQNYKNLSILLLTNSDSIDILCYLEKYLRDNRFMLLKSDFKLKFFLYASSSVKIKVNLF